jgi:DNA mismatch repair protein MutS2
MTADYCAGSLGRKLVVEITPSDDFTEVVTRLEQTEEFRKIISNSEPFPFEVYPDISSELKLLGIRNSVLTLSQLVLVYKVMNHARAVYDFFKERTIRFPLLFAVLNDIPFEKSIITSIEEVIDDTGSIRSSASPDLARIRKQLGRKRIEANQIYMSVIAKYRKSGWLTSEAEESWRNGRRVVAIVAEQKRTAKGIVHDISATGKTCFIEPEETLGINAMLIQLEQEEQEEIRKILKELKPCARAASSSARSKPLNAVLRYAAL